MTAGPAAYGASRRARVRRQAALAAQRRRRRRILGGAVAAVVLVIAGLAVTAALSGGSDSPAAADRTPVAAAVVDQVAGVPASTLTKVGSGDVTSPPRPAGDPPLTADGKPLVLYIGAEYCPFCAAERWPLVQALSRFGTFHGLTASRSASNDVHPDTATFSFADATYTSDYLSFDARELYTNEIRGGHYVPLQKLDPEQQSLFARYGGGFPFVDLGGRFVVGGASYDPDVLHELTVEQIAGSLADPESPVARAVDGSANVLTAALCELTRGKPVSVCTAPAVVTGAGALHG